MKTYKEKGFVLILGLLLLATGLIATVTTSNVVVAKDNNTPAETSDNGSVKVSPSPTPTSTTGVTVDKNSVEDTLDKVDVRNGLVFGLGFNLTSIDADGWTIINNEPTSGQGFYEASGGIIPGTSVTIRTYINRDMPNGIYTGSYVIKYAKNNVWYVGPTVTYKITLIDSSGNIPVKKVFVTSKSYDGNLGGLSGADAKCQERASAAGLAGTYKAWLSDGKTSAASRLTHSKGKYTLVNGTEIAGNWNDLIDHTLYSSIYLSETGSQVPVAYSDWNVWTNTYSDGRVN